VLAEAAGEHALEHEQRALAEEARGEAERLLGAAAQLARTRAEMHERWAEVHAARALVAEARARGDQDALMRHESEAHDRELLASAAEQRVDAAEHRARAEALRIADAAVSQTELEERIRQRRARTLEHEKSGWRRFRFGPGDSFYSPGMLGTASSSSRVAAIARENLDREIEVIARALREHGPLERDELKRRVGGHYWGPSRFRAALRAAVREGRATPHSRTIYGPPPTAEPPIEPAPTTVARHAA
jgi:hypothetical protein